MAWPSPRNEMVSYTSGQCHCLNLIVRDVYESRAVALVQLTQLSADFHAQLGVQVREWLVEQEDVGFAHDGTAGSCWRNSGHPLALPAR